MTSQQDWENLLRDFSQKIIKIMLVEGTNVPPDIIKSQWLGLPGASEEEIIAAETILKVAFSPSYRELLKLTNGWLTFSGYDDPWIYGDYAVKLLSTNEIGWHELPEYSKLEGRIPFINDLAGSKIDNAIEFIYDSDGEFWLLVPEIVDSNNEYPAWNLSYKGICVYKYESLYEAIKVGIGRRIDSALEDYGLN